MRLCCTYASARSATVIADDGGLYETLAAYRLTLNGLAAGEQRTVVHTLYGLEPDTDYELAVHAGDALIGSVSFRTAREACTLNVRRFGARGDGLHDDTAAIQAAICCCPPQGRVLIPRGRYVVSPLFLKSHIRLELAEGAELLLRTERESFPVLPGITGASDGSGEKYLGLWEGDPLDSFASLVTGIDVEDVVIYGRGVLDGRAQEGDWWTEPKTRRGAWRGRMLYLHGCKDIVVQGLSFKNSPAWNLHPSYSDDLAFYNVTVTAPANSPNTDGFDPESCKNVTLAGARFSLGDDCVAIKSGKAYLGGRLKKPCENIQISHCLMENGHGGVTIGSEMSGGVRGVTVRACHMRSTDRGLRIKTRRGRGATGVIDDILLDNVLMEGVGAPLTVNALYFCDPDGHGEYAQSTAPLPVDARTPYIGRITMRSVRATGCRACAAYILGLPEAPVREVRLSDSSFGFDADAEPFAPVMADCVKPCSRLGITARNVESLVCERVSIDGQQGERIATENVTHREDIL